MHIICPVNISYFPHNVKEKSPVFKKILGSAVWDVGPETCGRQLCPSGAVGGHSTGWGESQQDWDQSSWMEGMTLAQRGHRVG